MNYRCSIALFSAMLCACAHHAESSGADAAPNVAVTTVRYGSYVETVSAIGRLGAPAGTETKLSFAVPGTLQTIFVRIGDRVTAGEPLAQIDTSGLALSAQQAQADVAAAAANARQSAVDRTSTKLAVDEAALRREQSLYAAGVAALKDVQAAAAQVAQDRADIASTHAQTAGAGAQVQSAQARAALAQRDLSNGTLRAPEDGVVTAIYKHDGEAVDTSTPVLAIGPASSHDVTLTASASDAAGVHNGDRVALAIPGTHMTTFGRVSGVATAIDPATQAATITVSAPPLGAPAGSAVQATIDVSHDRGIIIPQTAVVQDPQSGDTIVFVQTKDKSGNAKFEQRSVQVARQNGAQALVRAGLRPGERIATQGAFALLAPAGSGD